MEVNKISDYVLNSECYDWAMGQIKSGSYNKSDSWSFNDASDGGNTKQYLAKVAGADPKVKGDWHFPIAKGGTLYRSGVAAASRMGSGARSGVKNQNIADAAHRLLEAMNTKEKIKEMELNVYQKVDIPVELSIPFVQSFEGDDGEQYLEFLGSTTDTSLSGHRMQETAIGDMNREAIGKSCFINHNADKVFGVITSVDQSNPTEFRPRVQLFKETGDALLDEPVKTVKNWVNQGKQIGHDFLGASCGSKIKQMKLTQDDNKDLVMDVKNIAFLEMSATPIPAVTRTKGEVKPVTCKGGMCTQIANQILQTYTPTIEDEDVVVDEIKEEIIMVDEIKDKNEVKELKEQLAELLTEKKEREEKLRIEEAAKKELESKEALKSEILEAVKVVVKEELGSVVKEMKADRTEVPGVVKEKANGELPDIEPVVKKPLIGQSFTNPAEYPVHVGGIEQTGYTSEELAQMI